MPDKLADITQTTLGELIELAIEKELVEFCYLASNVVVLSLSGHQLSYPPEEARSFLRALVQGWSRARAPHEAPHEKEKHGMASIRGSLFPSGEKQPRLERPGAAHALETAAPTPAEPPAATAEQTGRSSGITPSEDYIDAVLSFAEEMRLIEGFDKDERTGRVTLHTQATTTEMTYFETLEYLTNSILHELRGTSPA